MTESENRKRLLLLFQRLKQAIIALAGKMNTKILRGTDLNNMPAVMVVSEEEKNVIREVVSPAAQTLNSESNTGQKDLESVSATNQLSETSGMDYGRSRIIGGSSHRGTQPAISLPNNSNSGS